MSSDILGTCTMYLATGLVCLLFRDGLDRREGDLECLLGDLDLFLMGLRLRTGDLRSLSLSRPLS